MKLKYYIYMKIVFGKSSMSRLIGQQLIIFATKLIYILNRLAYSMYVVLSRLRDTIRYRYLRVLGGDIF